MVGGGALRGHAGEDHAEHQEQPRRAERLLRALADAGAHLDEGDQHLPRVWTPSYYIIVVLQARHPTLPRGTPRSLDTAARACRV